MIRTPLFTVALVFAVSIVCSQNLVPNPSMETTSPCPSGGGQVSYATGWSSTLNSPDYFHTCGSGNFTTPGPNLGGTQTPFHGGAYSAMVCRHSSAFYREHQGIALTTPLVAGQTYHCSMRISLCDISQYAANRMGFFFNTSLASGVGNYAHVYTNSIITDKNNWILVSGDFVAAANYTHVFVGNFYDDSNTSISPVAGGWYAGAYYYVDSIIVTPVAVVLDGEQVALNLVSAESGSVKLAWENEPASDFQQFVIERSRDGGMNFEQIATVQKKDSRHYTYVDHPGYSNETVIYQLRAIDGGGGTHLSARVEARPGKPANDFLCYPSTVAKGSPLTIRKFVDAGEGLTATLTDISGRKIIDSKPVFIQDEDEILFDTDGLGPGIYLLELKGTEKRWWLRFTVSN